MEVTLKTLILTILVSSRVRGSKELSRQRRFITPATTGWTITSAFTLKIPLEGLGTSVDITLPITFALPNLARKKRSIVDMYTERDRLLETVEGFLPHVMTEVTDSHGCMLRAICEVAKAPTSDEGIFADIVTHVLSPQFLLKPEVSFHNQTDYITAQWKGHFTKDCTEYESSCPTSFFQITYDEEDNMFDTVHGGNGTYVQHL